MNQGIKRQPEQDDTESAKNPIEKLPPEVLFHIFDFALGSDVKQSSQIRAVNHTWCAIYDHCLSLQMHQRHGLVSMHRAKGFINRWMGWTEETQHSLTSEDGRIALFEKQQRNIESFKKYKCKIIEIVGCERVNQSIGELDNLPKENHIMALLAREKALTALNELIIRQRIEESIKQGASELDCDFCYLTDFPASIIADPSLFDFWSNLSILSIQACCLDALPANIGMLKKLTQIFAIKNNLCSLPDSISELTALFFLDLAYNKFKTLPDNIAQLTSLHTLDLSNNLLRELPDDLEKFPALEVLNVEDNRLNSIPNGLKSKLGNLEEKTTESQVLSTQRKFFYFKY